MAGIARRLAKVCCGSSAALSDTKDIEADRPDSSQCHGQDQQESADQRHVLEAGLEVLQRGKQQPCWLDHPCELDMCVAGIAVCLTSMVALNSLSPLQVCSQLMYLLLGFVICLLLSASAEASHTDCIHVTKLQAMFTKVCLFRILHPSTYNRFGQLQQKQVNIESIAV